MEFIIIGVAAAFNLIVVMMKFERKRYGDAFFDVSSLIILDVLFGGSYAGMVVATVASAIISIYLYYYPPKFLPNITPEELATRFKRPQ